MAAIIANSTALKAVLSSSAAMSAVAASQTAMAAIVASQTARKAIESSNTAISALSASSRVVTGYATIGTAYNKDCWLFQRAVQPQIVAAISTQSATSMTAQQLKPECMANTHKAVSRFAKNAAVIGIDTAGGWQHEIKYIPC